MVTRLVVLVAVLLLLPTSAGLADKPWWTAWVNYNELSRDWTIVIRRDVMVSGCFQMASEIGAKNFAYTFSRSYASHTQFVTSYGYEPGCRPTGSLTEKQKQQRRGSR